MRRTRVQGHPFLQNKIEISIDSMRPHLKRGKNGAGLTEEPTGFQSYILWGDLNKNGSHRLIYLNADHQGVKL